MILLHGVPAFSGGDLFVILFFLLVLFVLSLALLFGLPLQIAKKLPKRNAIIGNIGIAAIYIFIAFQMGTPLWLAWTAGLPALIIALVSALPRKDNG